MHDERGVVYITFGDKSIEQAEVSKAALVRHNPWLTPGSIKIIGGPTDNPAINLVAAWYLIAEFTADFLATLTPDPQVPPLINGLG